MTSRRLRAISALLTVLLAITVAPAAPAAATGTTMPAFSPAFAPAASFYRIRWTADGYPARLEPDGSLYEHPIYPVYVLEDYLAQNAAHPTATMRAAIRTVAHAAIRRMKAFHGGLVFWYAEGGPARATQRHYSALTSSYYATKLQAAYAATGDVSLATAARRCFSALLVPASSGGVLYRDRNGISIAEVPQAPNSYILNGWLSALVSVWKYWQASADVRARDLVRNSAKAVARVLPRYDSHDLGLSRYGLSGFLYVRVVGTTYSTLAMTIPGERTYTPVVSKRPYRWQLYRLNASQANIVVSYGSWPIANTLTIKPARPARVQAYVGSYDPRSSAPVRPRWIDIGTVTPSRPSVKVPWSVLDKVVYPTNFAKKIGGHQVNVYHTVHIRRLRELYAITPVPALRVWANKWAADMCSWGRFPIFRGLYAVRVPEVEPAIVPVTKLC